MLESLVQFLTEPWQYSFLVRALILAVLAGIMCPLLGTYVVARQFGFMGDALAHSVLPGMVVAFWLGASPFLGAIVTAVGMALLIGYLVRRTGIGADTSIGILFAGFFALGMILLNLLPTNSLKIDDILLGQVLAATWTDVAMAAGLTLVVLLVLAALHRDLVFVTFDPIWSLSYGIAYAGSGVRFAFSVGSSDSTGSAGRWHSASHFSSDNTGGSGLNSGPPPRKRHGDGGTVGHSRGCTGAIYVVSL